MSKKIDWFHKQDEFLELDFSYKYKSVKYNIKILSLDSHIIDEGKIATKLFLIKTKDSTGAIVDKEKNILWKLQFIQTMNHNIDEGQLIECDRDLYISIDETDDEPEKYLLKKIKPKTIDENIDKALNKFLDENENATYGNHINVSYNLMVYHFHQWLAIFNSRNICMIYDTCCSQEAKK